MHYREQTISLNAMALRDVGTLLGLTLPLRGTVHCPFNDHDDKSPSFEVRPSGNRWVCYGCNRNGGAIDFVKTYLGLSFVEAKQWLTTHTKLSPEPVLRLRRGSPQPKSIQSSSERVEVAESPPDYELYEAFLKHTELQATGRSYLVSRGLSEATVDAFRIGQLSDGSSGINRLIQEYGYGRVDAAGLLTKHSSINNWRPLIPDGSLVFPFLEGGRIPYLQARLITYTKAQGKWRNLNHRKRRIYNADSLTLEGNRPFAVCEGVMDVLSAIELGYDAIGIMGVNASLTEQNIKALRGRQVAILMDWDVPGEKRAGELQREMRRFGVVSIRKRRPSPEVKDVNDYLMLSKGLL